MKKSTKTALLIGGGLFVLYEMSKNASASTGTSTNPFSSITGALSNLFNGNSQSSYNNAYIPLSSYINGSQL